jgi:hypothetical protein
MKRGAFSVVPKAHHKICNGNCQHLQTMTFAIETFDISMTHESSHVKITNEQDAHHFLQYQMFALNSFYKAKQLTTLIVWKY